MVILRILHIAGGVFWAGATLFIVSFLFPAVQAAGPEGGKVMQRLTQGPYSRATAGAAAVTILSGLLLYLRDSAGLRAEWIGSAFGLTITIGALAAIITYAWGLLATKPAADRLGELSKAAVAGGAPSPAQAAEIQRLQAKLASSARLAAYLLGVAVLAMAAARYL